MLKMQSAFFLMLLPPVVFAGNQWNVTVAGGNMRFQGEIIAEACRVEAGSHNMTVIMGQVSSNRFHAVGEDAGPTPFEINLLDCSTAVSQRVSVAFHGIADGKTRSSCQSARGMVWHRALEWPFLMKRTS